jgi:tetratricopeptide (TPR) repeat protein
MTHEARIPSSSRKKVAPAPVRPGAPVAAPHTGPFFNHYQAALQLMQQARFEKALVAFEKLLPTAPTDAAERCRMYIKACQRQLASRNLTFDTPEEQYDYAVSLLNTDYYEEAREQFLAILSNYPDASYAAYGLAVLDAITGQTEECLDHLSQAIDSHPRYRLQARTDTDFQSMVDDPRFTELLYPETL